MDEYVQVEARALEVCTSMYVLRGLASLATGP